MTLGRENILITVSSFQLLSFSFYLLTNIYFIGSGGVLSGILITNFCLIFIFLNLSIRDLKYLVNFSTYVVLLFILWIYIRVSIDQPSWVTIKSVFFGTSGGVITFLILGNIMALHLNYLSMTIARLIYIEKFFNWLLAGLVVLIMLLYQRKRSDIFLIDGINGEYQRAGNFLSFYFLLFTCCFVFLLLKRQVRKDNLLNHCGHYAAYILGYLVTLVISQLIGSNSASAVVFGIGAISIVLAIALRHDNETRWSTRRILLSREIVMKIIRTISLFILLLLSSLLVVYFVTGYSIFQIGLFSFGSKSISSLESRILIFQEYGLDQLAYAPFWGNYNVSEIVVGKPGVYIHALFPNIMSKLGVVGLLIFCILCISICYDNNRQRVHHLSYKAILSSNLVPLVNNVVFVWVLFVGGISVDVSWSVLWFSIGFIGCNIKLVSRA